MRKTKLPKKTASVQKHFTKVYKKKLNERSWSSTCHDNGPIMGPKQNASNHYQACEIFKISQTFRIYYSYK